MRYTVRVKPGSRRGPLVETSAAPSPDSAEGMLTVHVRERAVDGAANEAALKVLARHFETAPSRVRIVGGHTARIKRIEVDD